MLSCAIAAWIAVPGMMYSNAVQAEGSVYVTADKAHEDAKYNSQQVSIITKKDIEQKQAKSVEDIIFTESGVSRTVDSMGRVGVSIRGAEARHTLILVDGQAVLGDLAKFSGAADEVMRLGTENVERIEIVQGSASAKYGSDAIGGVVNIITKKAAKKPTIQINGEGSRAKGGETGFKNSNFFLRADSGQMGKVRVAISGSKRDVMPVLGTKARKDTGDTLEGDFKPNALRYYGITDDIGFNATYDINKNNNIQLRLDRFTEDLVRDVKNTTSPLEPQRHFKRDSNRNTMNVIWNGKSGVSDWKLELNHSRINENDISLVDYSGRSKYEGKNELKYIDDIDHRQTDVRFNANSAIGDNHTLSWGFANTTESGSGSRLKNSPITRTKYIDPFNYSKDLLVAGVDRLQRKAGDNSLRVWSHVHDYKISFDKNNKPFYDQNYEYYGATTPTEMPPITYEEFLDRNMDSIGYMSLDKYNPDYKKDLDVDETLWNRIRELDKRLRAENKGTNFDNRSSLWKEYFTSGESLDPSTHAVAPTLNGVKFLDKYRERDQRVTEGEGTIRKQNVYLSDAWQVNKDLLIQPTIRLDKSNLFGSHVSWNLGATYNVNSNPHRRLKANIGTGYAEPGMGELWYSWQMFDSTPLAVGYSKMGWYWIGNPNLKPETSKNIDLSFEGEGKNDYARLGVFQNRIKNYMSVYFTGSMLDWAPRLSKDDKWMRAPDLVYSFKNIGEAKITGLQLEWKHKFGPHWSTRFGWTHLQALNQSDPTMPKHLLDRPTNKIDFGITYETNKWNAQVWADYYHKMLDSNTLEGKSNYWNGSIDSDSRIYNKVNIYEEKSYGIWNAMIQRKFGKDSLAYFGINNLFDHRDDDRATQARVYRFGLNFKFGADGHSKDHDKKSQSNGVVNTEVTSMTSNSQAQVEKVLSTVNGEEMGHTHQFLDRPFDVNKEKGTKFIGDYRTRLMAHDGSEHAQSLYTSSAHVDTGAYNFKDNNEHGFEQRIRFGVDARINDHTNIKVLASASGEHSVDSASTTVNSKGLNKQRLESLDLTHSGGHWDFSVGRLSEKMGTTGYWFNKTFDGIRAVWTDQQNQFRAGVGSFKSSTGISDSAYNHSEYDTFFRAPTMNEFIGLYRNLYGDTLSAMYKSSEDGANSPYKWEDGKRVPSEGSAMDVYRKLYKGKNENLYFMEQLSEVDRDMADASEDERNAKKIEIIRRMATIINKAYPELLNDKYVYNLEEKDDSVKVMYEVSDEEGNKAFLSAPIKSYKTTIFDPGADKPELRKIEIDEKKKLNEKVGRPLSDLSLLDPSTIETNINTLTEHYTDIAKWVAKDDWFDKYIYAKDRTHDEIETDGNTVVKENSLGFSEENWGIKSYKYNLFKLENGMIKEMTEDEKDALNKPLSKYHLTGVTKIVKVGRDSHYNTVYGDVNIVEELKKGNFSTVSSDLSEGDLPRIAKDYLGLLDLAIRDSETGNTLPREALEKIIGKPIKVTGLTLQRDTIPAIDKAIFAQYKTRINDKLGIQAWFLHSLNDKNTEFKSGFMGTTAKTVRVQIGTGPSTTDEDGYDIPGEPIYGDKTIELPNPINHTYTSSKLANVFAIGLQYQLGNSALLSVDYGQNRTDFGRYMNGHTNYEHTPGTADFKLKGHSMGGTPHFWTARLDIGQSDYTRPGSWNAFMDYKYFAHGSFFGGNGTGAVPDRYLDGIRSFTVGGGYVPRKDLLLEAFYTFDAKGIGERDTLYGAENFKLGNYTRIQGTYKF